MRIAGSTIEGQQLGRGTHYFSLPDVDRYVTSAYWCLRPLFTRVGQLALLIIAVAGAAVFCEHVNWNPSTLASSIPQSLVALVLSLAIHTVLHEMGHATVCKHFGREVHRAGAGWYMFFPVAFVDTSDIWAASRQARIVVSTGPFVNVVLSGLASLIAVLIPAGCAQNALWAFSAMGYFFNRRQPQSVNGVRRLLHLDGLARNSQSPVEIAGLFGIAHVPPRRRQVAAAICVRNFRHRELWVWHLSRHSRAHYLPCQVQSIGCRLPASFRRRDNRLDTRQHNDTANSPPADCRTQAEGAKS